MGDSSCGLGCVCIVAALTSSLRPPPTSATVCRASSFNGDVSQWDVSSVTDMGSMCKWPTPAIAWDVCASWPPSPPYSAPTPTSATVLDASSFNQKLSGAWTASRAKKEDMFFNCPGSRVKRGFFSW